MPPSWVDSHKVSSTRLSFQHPLAQRTCAFWYHPLGSVLLDDCSVSQRCRFRGPSQPPTVRASRGKQSSVFPSTPPPTSPSPGSRVAVSFCISATVQGGERHRHQQPLKRGVSEPSGFAGRVMRNALHPLPTSQPCSFATYDLPRAPVSAETAC